MAHLKTLREFRAWCSAWRDRLPLDCLLCGSRSPGGLCAHCRAAVQATMSSDTPRCGRCALSLALAAPGSKPPAASIVEQAVRRVATRLGLRYPLDSDMAGVAGRVDCPDCAALPDALKGVVAAFDYHWPGDLLIQRLKMRGRFACAPLLAGLLAQRSQALREAGMPLWCEQATLVTAVPADRAALVLRGYNPAAETGRALAQRLALEWRPGLVSRSRQGGAQKNRGRRDRRLGVRGLYHCNADLTGREVLIVDDVMTTGSTLGAIANILREQGAERIWAAVPARTPARH